MTETIESAVTGFLAHKRAIGGSTTARKPSSACWSASPATTALTASTSSPPP